MTLSIAGTSFQLHKGPHGGHGASTIFTFVANSEQSSYNGNLLDFYYLVDNGTGMEAFTANNINFPTSKYLYHAYQLDWRQIDALRSAKRRTGVERHGWIEWRAKWVASSIRSTASSDFLRIAISEVH